MAFKITAEMHWEPTDTVALQQRMRQFRSQSSLMLTACCSNGVRCLALRVKLGRGQ